MRGQCPTSLTTPRDGTQAGLDAEGMLTRTALALIMSDRDVELGWARVHRRATLPSFGASLLFADSNHSEWGVHACCQGQQLGDTRATAQQKLERVIPLAATLFRQKFGEMAEFNWFVFSETDTWWQPDTLARFLVYFESELKNFTAPSSARPSFGLHAQRPLVTGGGVPSGFHVHGPFIIMSKAALQWVLQPGVLAWCRRGMEQESRLGPAPCMRLRCRTRRRETHAADNGHNRRSEGTKGTLNTDKSTMSGTLFNVVPKLRN